MVIETAKKQVVVNKVIGQKKESKIVENDIIVNDIKPDVLNVISATGIINIYKKEVMDGKVKIDGTINTYIIYLADDESGRNRSLNANLDFTQIIDIDNCKENMQIEENIIIKSIDAKIINGRKLNIKANIETSLMVYSNEKIDVITEINTLPNVQTLNNIQSIAELIGSGRNRVSIKDTIAIDVADDFAEIIKVKFNIVDEETKISYNKVLSKADAVVEIMYLTEDNRINSATTRIPIMGFIDIQNINEECECKIKNTLCNLIIKPNMGEEHSIYVEAEIEVNCSAYEKKEIDIIEDLYSINDEVDFNKKEIEIITERNTIKDLYTIKENIRIPELTGRVYDVQINPIINNVQIRKNKVIYEGILPLEILLEENNGINRRTVELPFNFEIISDKINEKSIINTNIRIKQNDFVIRDGTVESTIGLEFVIDEQKIKTLSIIEQIKLEESKNCNNYSMIIYFAKPGDTLWKIAKTFRSTVQDIAKVNDIEDANRINVGQQLYIPRFCKNKAVV